MLFLDILINDFMSNNVNSIWVGRECEDIGGLPLWMRELSHGEVGWLGQEHTLIDGR